MEFAFCMQDPSDPATYYLHEAIVEAVAEATTWRGMFAFASHNGVNQLIEDPAVLSLMGRGGRVDLVVGIDAVTNRQTLERLLELEQRHPLFSPKVFWSRKHGLFHPKISHFMYADGRTRLIVGSGNLTPGGLKSNFEGYSVISTELAETLDVSSLDAFIARHVEDIRSIDQEALDRAALNTVRSVSRGARTPGGAQAPAEEIVASIAASLDRVLVAQVPRAGGRWSQVHFNKDTVEQYFKITNLHVQRVYLTRVDNAGNRGDEEVRPCVYSQSNKNYKIEIAAAKGREYPEDGVPVLVLRERQVRVFDYMLLFPGDPGHAEMKELSLALNAIGRGLPRVITDVATLVQAWPSCPLSVADENAPVEID